MLFNIFLFLFIFLCSLIFDTHFEGYVCWDAGATAAVIGAGLSTAAGVGSAAIQAGAKWGSSTYMRVAKQMAQYNNALAISNWNKENEYNSPAAQMERYKAAGLNPNLIYGQQNTGGTIQSGQVSTNPQDYQPDSIKRGAALQAFAGAMSQYQDLIAKQGQIDNTRAVTQNVHSQKALNYLNAEGKALENRFASDAYDYKLEGIQLQNAHSAYDLEQKNIFGFDKALWELEKLKSDVRKSDADVSVKEKQLDVYDAQIDHLNWQKDEAIQRLDILGKQISLGYGELSQRQKEFEYRKERDKSNDLREDEATNLRQQEQDQKLREAAIKSVDQSVKGHGILQPIISGFNELPVKHNGEWKSWRKAKEENRYDYLKNGGKWD